MTLRVSFLVMFAGALLVVAGVLWLSLRRRRPAHDGPRCGGCGYNLTAATENRCPECGGLFIDVGVELPARVDKGRRKMFVAGIAASVVILLLGVLATTFFAVAARRAQAAAVAARVQAQAQAAQAAAVAKFIEKSLANGGALTSQPTTAPAAQGP